MLLSTLPIHMVTTLSRCSTGEAWPDIMMSAVAGRPCDPDAHKWNYTKYGELYMTDPEKRCGNPVTYLYFISFIFLCSFIMLNIVVAVITDSFDYLTRDSSILGSHHLSEFVTTWCEYDPGGEGLVHYTDLLALLRQVGQTSTTNQIVTIQYFLSRLTRRWVLAANARTCWRTRGW